MVTWTNPTIGVGWIISLVTLIITCIFWGMGFLPKEAALLIIAVCSIRL